MLRSLKGRTGRPPQLQEKEEILLALIARKEVTMKKTIGNCIQKRHRNNSTKMGRQKTFYSETRSWFQFKR